MKRIVNVFAAVAALLLSAACQKGQEIAPENVVNIAVLSSKEDNPEDSFKTYIGENSFTGAIEAKWDGSDNIMLYEYVDNVLAQSASSNSTELTDGDRIAKFNIPLDITKPTGEAYIYEAVYPENAVSQGGGDNSKFDRVEIPQNQNAVFITDIFSRVVKDPFTANIDPKADVLIGKPVARTTRPEESEELSFSFKRIGTVGKLVLKNLGAGEKVKSVEISLPGGKVTGFSKIDIQNGAITEAGYSTKESVKVSIPNDGNYSMETYEDIPCNIYFRCLSGTWAKDTQVTVKVETSAAIYTKTSALPRDYEFIEGGLTSFAFNMATADRQAISTDDYSGEWMIVGENSGTLYAMPAYESGNNIKAVEYTLTPEGKATSEDGLDNCCYTITKITEGDYSGYYTIQDVNGLFLYAAGGSSSNYLKGASSIPTSLADAYYWDITCISGKYSIVAKSSGRNTMQFNSNNILFACYDGASQKAVSLFPWDDVVVDTTPVITVSSTELTLNADGTIQGEEITVSGNKYLTGAITATSSDESWLLASVEDGKLVVVADENTGEERTATVTLSYTGAESVIVTVTQLEPGSTTSKVLSFDFVNHPSGWPTSSSTSKEGSYNYSLTGQTYTFSHSKTGNGIYMGGTSGSSGYLMIVSGNKLGLPAIEGYKLTKVVGTLNGSGTPSTSSKISITNGTTIVTGGDAQTWSTKGGSYTYTLSNTEEGTMYYLSVSSANCQLITLELTYEQAPIVHVTSVAVSGTPSKTEYKAGDNFETAGLTVTATFDDASTKDVTDEVEWTITPSGALAAGITSVSVVATYKSVASEAYTVNGLTVTEPQALSTIQDIFDAATSTEANAKVKFGNWVVSGVKGSNAYVTDGTKGLIIYQSGHGFEVGDILSGTVDCKLVIYNGSAELKEVFSSTTGLTVTKGGVITPATIAISDLSGVNTGAVITFESLNYNGSVFSDGTNTIKPYNTFITLPSLISGRNYKVTGVYIQYGTTKEIAPRAAEDFVIIEEPYLIASADQTSVAAAGGTVTITVDTNVEGWTVTSDNDAFVVGAKSGNTVPVTVSENTSTTDGRTAKITVSATGVDDVVITLTQSKKSSGTGLAVGTVLWGENFAHFGTNTPSAAGTGTGTTIYGEASITYAQSSTGTKGYNETLAGGTAPELLLSKSNQTWTISGIPCDGASEMSLTFLSNKTTFSLSTTTDGISFEGSQKSWTIKNTKASTFDLVIKNTGSSNARIDDVVLKVTAN